MPYAGFRPDAGPIRKIRQQTAIRVYVTGADSFRTARPAGGRAPGADRALNKRALHLPIMNRA
ncbi:hypothetical protein SGFS_084550 [Streptomyces graminofaciens]|uniref:Uncharacterized protein n=1 Tax=Streptomyces graminofaciens TaxID=68212 RepID=A0ABM7FJ68_9ACTN|nr:hypothetical protein SGFS_084550 [Streptomyces graminofaciens]